MALRLSPLLLFFVFFGVTCPEELVLTNDLDADPMENLAKTLKSGLEKIFKAMTSFKADLKSLRSDIKKNQISPIPKALSSPLK